MAIELRDYQKSIVDEEIKRHNVLVVAPMGAGKTMATLHAIATLIDREGVKNVLIIAPLRVAMTVWVQEAAACGVDLNIHYCKRFDDIHHCLITPAKHRIVVTSVTRIAEVPNGIWDMVVVDESTMFGNKSSQRSKEARRIMNRVPRRLLLTGTPIHGGYEKLWHQIFLLDGGKALGSNLTVFRNKYMQVKYQVQGVVTVYEVNPSKIPEIHENIKNLVHIVQDCVTLPDILYKNIPIQLPRKVENLYDEFERESIAEFGDFYGDPAKLVSFSSSARGIKLRQIASGMAYKTEDRAEWAVLHLEKLNAAKEIVENVERGVLIVYAFQSELAELKKEFKNARLLVSAQDIADWNAGLIDVALVHPASIGHGLNLQHGGNTIIWFTLTYDAELYAQVNKRLHRSGQKDVVSVIHLLASGTIDEKVLKVLQKKENLSKNFLKL